MNNDYRSLLRKYELHPKKVTIYKNTKVFDTKEGRFVFKKRRQDLTNTYSYLHSRSFDYFPKLVNKDDEYDIYEYVNVVDEPLEQKALDVINIMSILHSKTTFFKEVDFDDYKSIYEKIVEELEDTFNYYNNLMEYVEGDIYMSPASYLLARNISTLYSALEKSRTILEKWYELIKDKKNMRVVNIHNNMDLSHYLKDRDKSYFVSWDKSKIDMPIIDLYVFYKRHYLDFDFIDLLDVYESRYPLLKEEKLLFYAKILIPWKINFNGLEYNLCIKVRNLFDYLYKSDELTKYGKPETTK